MKKLTFSAGVKELDAMYRTPWGRIREELLCGQLRELHTGHFKGVRRLCLLDAGCGLGQYSAFLVRRGWKATLADPDPQILKAAKQRMDGSLLKQCRFVNDRLEDMTGSRAEDYDLAMAHVVLEYIDSPEAALAMMAERLKKRGMLSLVYNQTLPAALFRVTRGKLSEAGQVMAGGMIMGGKMGPCRTFHRREMNELLKKAGFEIVCEWGLRMFCDYLPNRVKMEKTGFAELLRLEKRYSADEDFFPLARMMHVVGRVIRS